MSFDPLSAAFDVGKTIIEKIWPDPVAQAKEIRLLEELRQTGNLAQLNARVAILTGQMGINAKEAEHKSVFVAGWRPFVGWVGGFALAYQFILYPLMLWVWAIVDPTRTVIIEATAVTTEVINTVPIAPPPVLDAEELYTVLLGMLGIGAMRSYDKKNGTATQTITGK